VNAHLGGAGLNASTSAPRHSQNIELPDDQLTPHTIGRSFGASLKREILVIAIRAPAGVGRPIAMNHDNTASSLRSTPPHDEATKNLHTLWATDLYSPAFEDYEEIAHATLAFINTVEDRVYPKVVRLLYRNPKNNTLIALYE